MFLHQRPCCVLYVCVWLSVFSLSLSLCLIHTISIIDESIEEASSKGSDGTRRPFSLKFEPQVTLAECSTRLIWSSRAFILWPGSRLLGQSEPSRAAAGIYTNFSGMNWLQRCKIGRNGRAWLQSWSSGAQDNKETMEGNCGRKENVKLKFERSKVSQHSLPCVGEFSVPMSVHLPSFSLSTILSCPVDLWLMLIFSSLIYSMAWSFLASHIFTQTRHVLLRFSCSSPPHLFCQPSHMQ